MTKPQPSPLAEEVEGLATQLARSKPETASDRYGDKLAGLLHHPADTMPEPEHVVMQTKPAKGSRARNYPTGSHGRKENAAHCHSALLTLSEKIVPDRDTRIGLVKLVMEAVKPKNELEIMLAAQMIGAHAAAMQAYGRANRAEHIPNLETYLNQASKASRTYVTLLEALDRHRGKGGQQRVRVEYVNVYEGGQAIVGAIEAPGGAGGGKRKSRLPHAQHAIADARQPALRCEEQERQPVPRAGDDERPLQDARGQEPGRTSR